MSATASLRHRGSGGFWLRTPPSRLARRRKHLSSMLGFLVRPDCKHGPVAWALTRLPQLLVALGLRERERLTWSEIGHFCFVRSNCWGPIASENKCVWAPTPCAKRSFGLEMRQEQVREIFWKVCQTCFRAVLAICGRDTSKQC